jgi:hypothetical protein
VRGCQEVVERGGGRGGRMPLRFDKLRGAAGRGFAAAGGGRSLPLADSGSG